jgi:hypothetical protein
MRRLRQVPPAASAGGAPGRRDDHREGSPTCSQAVRTRLYHLFSRRGAARQWVVKRARAGDDAAGGRAGAARPARQCERERARARWNYSPAQGHRQARRQCALLRNRRNPKQRATGRDMRALGVTAGGAALQPPRLHSARCTMKKTTLARSGWFQAFQVLKALPPEPSSINTTTRVRRGERVFTRVASRGSL